MSVSGRSRSLLRSFSRGKFDIGINFAAYEGLRGVITPPGKTTIPRKLLCGALAGSISQTLTYPCDVLRRKMQVAGMHGMGVKYTGAFDALRGILRTEGWRGLYRGLWPNLRECSFISSFPPRGLQLPIAQIFEKSKTF